MLRVRLGLVLLLAILGAVALAPPALARSSSAPAFVADEVVVKLRPGYRLTGLGRLFDVQGRELRTGLHPAVLSAELLDPDGGALLRLRAGSDVNGAVTALNGHPAVQYAEPNYIFREQRTPGDPAFSQQWWLQPIHAPAAWDITVGNEHIVIAVIDGGFSTSHEDLQGSLLTGYNAYVDNDDVASTPEHGTGTSGVVAASADNGRGIAGVCWRCRVLPIKAGHDGAYSLGAINKAIRYAADRGARVINMSFGGPRGPISLKEQINYAHSKGALLVAAAGNSGDNGNPVEYPAAFDHVLAVGATTQSDRIAPWSSYGSHLDLSAPGDGILTTWWRDGQNGYARVSGTSFSAPIVAGVAGLVLSVWPELGPDQLAQLLTGTADDLSAPGHDKHHGYGRINALKAVQSAQSRTIPGVPTALNPAFAPAAPPSDASVSFFPETGHTLRGAFKHYWETQGGLAVFGYPISEEFVEQTPEGSFLVQYFERQRFEFHPEHAFPYNVLLGRLGDSMLLDQGRNWFTFPRGQPSEGCRHFAETGHTLCEPFLSHWRNHGLQFDGQPGVSEPESLALFGMPLSEPQLETNASGHTVLTQWFERARFEYHPGNPPHQQLLLGLLGNELVDRRGWR